MGQPESSYESQHLINSYIATGQHSCLYFSQCTSQSQKEKTSTTSARLHSTRKSLLKQPLRVLLFSCIFRSRYCSWCGSLCSHVVRHCRCSWFDSLMNLSSTERKSFQHEIIHSQTNCIFINRQPLIEIICRRFQFGYLSLSWTATLRSRHKKACSCFTFCWSNRQGKTHGVVVGSLPFGYKLSCRADSKQQNIRAKKAVLSKLTSE